MDKDQSKFAELVQHGGAAIFWEDWSPVTPLLSELRNSATDASSFFSLHPNVLRELHRDVRIFDVNEFALKLMGAAERTQLIGPLVQVLPHSIFSFEHWITAILAGDPFYRGKNGIQRLDGLSVDMLITAALPKEPEDLNNIAVYAIDISEHRGGRASATSNAIVNTSRVAAMGALTASIAHEVRNPLAAIATNAGACLQWLRRPVPNLAEAEEAAASVIENAIHAQQVVDRTLAFLKAAPAQPESFDVLRTIRDLLLLTADELQLRSVSIEVESDEVLPRVRADQIQVQQILVNLLRNAVDAMSETEGPRHITISLDRQDANVRVAVSDTGPGIESHRLDRLFEPFYATKTQAIGIGLAVCRRCVEANGGKIWAKTEVGRGTTFYFTIPIADHAQLSN